MLNTLQDHFCTRTDEGAEDTCASGDILETLSAKEVKEMLEHGTGVPVNALPAEWAKDCSIYGSASMPVEFAMATLTSHKKVC